MTDDEILDGLLQREGGFRAQVTRPDGSIDDDTMYGVTATVLGEYLGLPRKATTEEVKALTPEMARTIFRKKYISGPGFTAENLPFEPLRVQLIDFGVNSGPERAVRWLQRCMGPWMPTSGKLDAHTLQELKYLSSLHTAYLRLLNDALCAARLYMIDRAVDTGRMRKADEEGVESRALEFFLAKP